MKISFLPVLMASGVALGAGSARAQDATKPAPSTAEQVAAPMHPVAASDAEAQRPEVNGPLTLDAAVRFALVNSPVVRGAQAEIDMALAQVETARAATRPTVSATTFATSGSEAGPIYNTPEGVLPQNLFAVPRGPFANQNLTLMWPLASGGRLKALVKQASAARRASADDLETVRLDLILEVKTAYRGALLAREMQTVAQGREQATAERLKNDTAAAEAGRLPQAFVLRDEAEDADARQEGTNAERDYKIALLMVRAAIGADPASNFTLADKLEDVSEPAPGDAVPLALKQRPELRAARSRLETARFGLAAASGASRPQLALAAMADANRMRGGSGVAGGASVGLVLGIPLFDGGLRRSERDASAAGINKARVQLDLLQIQVEREVESAQLTRDAAAKNVATSGAALASAEEEYRVAGLRYESGRSANLEVLDSLAALTRARGNRAKALYEAQISADQLARATGQP